MKEYKKSYLGFIVITLLYFAVAFAPIFIPAIKDRPGAGTSWMCFATALFVFAMVYYIYKSEKIYLFSGISYEDALKCTPEKRRNYAYLHVKKFLPCTVVLIAYSVLAYITKLPDAVSIVLMVVVLVATALSTTRIKLEEE